MGGSFVGRGGVLPLVHLLVVITVRRRKLPWGSDLGHRVFILVPFHLLVIVVVGRRPVPSGTGQYSIFDGPGIDRRPEQKTGAWRRRRRR